MQRDIDAHFVEQRSGPIGMPKSSMASSMSLTLAPPVEEISRLDEVGHEDAIDEKAGAVLHHHRQLADLLHEAQRAAETSGEVWRAATISTSCIR